MEKIKEMIRKIVREEGFSKGSRKDKEATKSRSTVLGMTQVEEEEAPSFDMSKTSDRGDGNTISGNLKSMNESTIKNIIRQAIIDEAKNWPLVEVGRTAGTETNQAAPPKSSAEKQAVKLYGAYIEYKMNSGNSEYGYADQRNQLALKMLKDKFKVPSKLKSKLKDKKFHDKYTDYNSIIWEGIEEAKLKRFKVFIDGEKEPLILTGKNENDVKKFAHQMMQNNKVKITKVVKEALTESLKGKFVVASIYGDLYTPKAVSEKKALKLMMKIADQYAGDNVFTLGAEYWNKPHKFNKKKIMVKEEKLTEAKYKTISLKTEKGYKEAERLQSQGWKVAEVGLFTINMVKEGNELEEGKTFKYKKNDWKKYQKLTKKKEVMIQTKFGDLFAWEDGSNYGVFATDEDGREIELDHDDIDTIEIF